jgi:hypothetical protein
MTEETEKTPIKIYMWAIEYAWGRGHLDYLAYSLAEDGQGLCSHLSSSIGWAKHDIGFTSNTHHDLYDECYPDGYQLIWLDDPKKDEGWKKAMELNKKQAEEKAKAETNE